VGPREALFTRRLVLRDVNWLGDGPVPAAGQDVAVRVRSTAPLQPATVYLDGGRVHVRLGEGEYGVAPGQACVVYADASSRARVLGGGWIESAAAGHDERSGVCARGTPAGSSEGRRADCGGQVGKHGKESGHEVEAADQGGARRGGSRAFAVHG
jgi:tRNA methyl transferase